MHRHRFNQVPFVATLTAVLTHLKGASTVSLRASATDSDGNAAKVTAIRAYKLRRKPRQQGGLRWPGGSAGWPTHPAIGGAHGPTGPARCGPVSRNDRSDSRPPCPGWVPP
ncbi:hypothetical protein GCM10023334_076090 [Nonomuraea thailandensis]